MKVSTRMSDGVGIVDVTGEVDMFTSPDLRQELQKLTGKRVPRIVVNLEGVAFMDSSGIATLVQALKEARQFDGRLILASPGETVMRVLRLSNLTTLFDVRESVESAVEGRS